MLVCECFHKYSMVKRFDEMDTLCHHGGNTAGCPVGSHPLSAKIIRCLIIPVHRGIMESPCQSAFGNLYLTDISGHSWCPRSGFCAFGGLVQPRNTRKRLRRHGKGIGHFPLSVLPCPRKRLLCLRWFGSTTEYPETAAPPRKGYRTFSPQCASVSAKRLLCLRWFVSTTEYPETAAPPRKGYRVVFRVLPCPRSGFCAFGGSWALP